MTRRLLAVLILLLGFGLRMVHLQARPLWYDEAFALLYAALSPARMIYGTVTPVEGAGAADVHPLLYYFLLHGWMKLGGESPLAARFLSVGLGMLALALLYRLAAWCFGRHTGRVAALLAAVNPFHVAYSQEARMYALLALAALVAAWALLRALVAQGTRHEKDDQDERQEGRRTGTKARGRSRPAVVRRLRFENWAWWALYAVAAALTLYAHNLGVFALLGLHVLVAGRRTWWRHLPALVSADLVALALFSPWLAGVLPGQVGFVERGYWLAPPAAEDIVRAYMLPVFSFYEPPPAWLVGMGLFSALLLLALLIARVWRTRSRAAWFLVLCWAPILILLLLSRWRPVYLERALLPSALFYLVAAGWLLARGGLPRVLRLALAGLLAASIFGSLAVHYTYASFPRPPFDEAVAHLQSRVAPDDAVVHTNKLTYFPMHGYDPELPGVFLADPPGSPQDTLAYPTQVALGIFATPTMDAAVGSADRVWLVHFTREVEEVRALGVDHPALAWLEGEFLQVEREQFSDLVVALYRRVGP